jgi:replicative DNA helicase
MKTWGDFKIECPQTGGTERFTTCPQCSPTRRKKNAKCLSLNIDKEVWHCHHCGWKGSLKQGEYGRPQIDRWKPLVYQRPAYTWQPPTSQLLEFFAERGIGPDVLTRYQITLGVEWIPQQEDRVPVICFPYLRRGEVVNVKYRTLVGKDFRQVADAEKILYGLDDLTDQTEAVIVEGEIDKLAFAQAGMFAVLSVPDGAPAANAKPSAKKFEYLEHCEQELNTLTRIILAVDNDEPGRALEAELLRRLSPERCWRVQWPEGIKDANELLLRDGPEALRQLAAEAQPSPIEHVLSITEIASDVMAYYREGRTRGLSTGFYNLDQLLTISPAQLTIVTGIPSHGKALAIDTPIPTPTGWVTMGDLKPGDTVFGDDGFPYLIEAVTETMLGRPCYELEFSDGTKIVADAEHLWLTSTDQDRRSQRTARQNRRTMPRPLRHRGTDQTSKRTFPSTKSTAHIAETLIAPSGKNNHQVPLAQAAIYPDAILPIHPYVLGVWLGDGCKNHSGFTCADPEIVREVERCGYPVTKWGGKYDYGIGGLQRALRSLGMIKNKHVPERYLHASIEQRLDLLRGLMDTDGYCGKDGQTEFSNTNAQLADAVQELAQSLGMLVFRRVKRAKLYGKDYGISYSLCIQTNEIIFRLPRKAARQRPFVRNMNRRIVRCRIVDSVPVKCIAVNSPSRLYLCSQAYIPTHNSEVMDALLVNMINEHGAVFGVCSPENRPLTHHIAKLAEKIEGLPFLPGIHERMNPSQLLHALEWLQPHLYVIDSPEALTVQELIDKARALVLQKGITHLILDPWNEFDHTRPPNQTETDYISQSISQLKNFARRHGVHVFVVAHPVKLIRDKNGNYPVPTPYDIAGSAHWRNKPDNCVTVWRNTTTDPHYSEIHVTKVRWKQNGHIGTCALQWDPVCGRYSPTTLRDERNNEA